MWAERKEIYRLKVEQRTLGNHFWTISFWEKKNCWVLEKWYYDVTGNNNQQMYENWTNPEFKGKNPSAIFLDASHRSSYYKLGADRPKDEDKWYPSRWFRKGDHDGSISILDCESLAEYKARETTVRKNAAEHKINKEGKTEKDMDTTVEEISSEIRVTGFPLLTDPERETRRQKAFRDLTEVLGKKKIALKQAETGVWYNNYWANENTEMINAGLINEEEKDRLQKQLPGYKANAAEAKTRVERLNRDIKHIHSYLYLLKYGTIAHGDYKEQQYQVESHKMIGSTKSEYRKNEYAGKWEPEELSDQEIKEAEAALARLEAGMPARLPTLGFANANTEERRGRDYPSKDIDVSSPSQDEVESIQKSTNDEPSVQHSEHKEEEPVTRVRGKTEYSRPQILQEDGMEDARTEEALLRRTFKSNRRRV